MLVAQSPLTAEQESIITRTLDCAFAVHRELGPGYRERIYQVALCLELEDRPLKFECEKPVVVNYRSWSIPGQRVDLVVENVVIVEIKSLSKLKKLHQRQVLSYLKACQLRVGLLLNFNTTMLKHGIKRVAL